MLLLVALSVAVLAAVRGMWSPCGLSMLSSLNPVSEAARGNRFWITACWYVLGALLGGALLGTGAGLAASGLGRLDASGTVVWSIALAAALVAVVSDTGLSGRSLPDHPRQVDERWLTKYRRWIYASGYGVQIGVGFATYIMTAAVYLVAVLAVVTGSPAQAFLVCAVFGAVRGLTIVVSAFARTPEQLRAVHRRLAALATSSLRVAIAAEIVVGTVAAWALGGPLAGAVVAATLATLMTLSSVINRPEPSKTNGSALLIKREPGGTERGGRWRRRSRPAPTAGTPG